MGKLIIEIIQHPKGTKERHFIRNEGVTIGRGYLNDIILDDPYVSENHLRIEKDEDSWILTSTNDENLTWKISEKNQEDQTIESSGLTSGDKFRIGKSIICVYDENHQVVTTKLLSNNKGISLKFIFLSIITLILSILWSAIIEKYLNNAEETTFLKHFSASTVIVTGVILWSGLWSFVTWLIKRETSFFKHAFIISLLILALQVKNFLEQILVYNIPNYALEVFLNYLFNSLAVTIALYFTLKTVTNTSLKKLKYISTSIIALFLSILIVEQVISADKFRNSPRIMTNLEISAFKITKSKNILNMKKDHLKLFDKIEKNKNKK